MPSIHATRFGSSRSYQYVALHAASSAVPVVLHLELSRGGIRAPLHTLAHSRTSPPGCSGLMLQAASEGQQAVASSSGATTWSAPSAAYSNTQLQQQALLAVASLLDHPQVTDLVLNDSRYSQVLPTFLQQLQPPAPPAPPATARTSVAVGDRPGTAPEEAGTPGEGSAASSRSTSAKDKKTPPTPTGAKAAAAAAAAAAAQAPAVQTPGSATGVLAPVDVQAGLLACCAAMTQHGVGADALLGQWAVAAAEEDAAPAAATLLTEMNVLGLVVPPQQQQEEGEEEQEAKPCPGPLARVLQELDTTATHWLCNSSGAASSSPATGAPAAPVAPPAAGGATTAAAAAAATAAAAAAAAAAVQAGPVLPTAEGMAVWGQAASLLVLRLLLAAAGRSEQSQLEAEAATLGQVRPDSTWLLLRHEPMAVVVLISLQWQQRGDPTVGMYSCCYCCCPVSSCSVCM
jgi:hypothetical protein